MICAAAPVGMIVKRVPRAARLAVRGGEVGIEVLVLQIALTD